MSLLTEVEYKLTEYTAATMVYFERHKLIEIAKVSKSKSRNSLQLSIFLLENSSGMCFTKTLRSTKMDCQTYKTYS